MGTKRVAIACQGGGTHAAFTWGVLGEILRTKKAWNARSAKGDTFDIVAISGTSAGALCALATWYGLVPNIADPECGTIDKAIERLDHLWTTFAATTPAETLHNQVVGTLLQWGARGVPFPGSNPYDVYGNLGLAGLSLIGARREYLEFPALLQDLCPHFGMIDWPGVASADLRIVVGAIEVPSGNFEVFDSDKTLEKKGLHPDGERIEQYNVTRWRMRREISLEGVAASGTLPEVLPAQEIRDMVFPTGEPGKTLTRNAYYWDGLYSQNPPVRDLLDAIRKEEKPDEIWVVRINPQEMYWLNSNISLEDIRDRENDLAGNLSLNQELDHILTINRWLEQFGDARPPLDTRKIVTVRTIKMRRETAWGLRYTSKFDRNPGHLDRLRDEGISIARQWLADWRKLGVNFHSYPNDARYPATDGPHQADPSARRPPMPAGAGFPHGAAEMFDIVAVLIALGLLIYLAFRGITLILLAPGAALLAAVLTGGLPILAAYTQIFMTNTGQFIIAFFPLFLLGAIFGKLMDDTGAAKSTARSVSTWLGPRRAIASVVLCCAVLTYGGVSAFVVAFAIFPVAAALFRDADIPKRLIPGALALGAFSFTMSALPGTPAIQNAIPMPFFGTTAFAAPGLGVVAALIMFGVGLAWLNRRAASARAAGEGYGEHADSLPKPDVVMREHAQSEGFDLAELPEGSATEENLPPFWLALLPVLVVIVSNFVFIQLVLPLMDTSYLADPLFGETTIESVRGVWAVIVGLFLASLLLIAGNWRRLTDLRASLDKGADASVLPIFNTASLVGFGAVIAALPVFGRISEAVLALGGGNPLVSVAGSVAILSAMTGSASGGMSIALDALGPTFVELARATGVSLEAMHRVTALASGALDALPHNGAVITLLAVCNLSHRDSYFDVFMASIVGPMIALIIILILASLVGSF